MMEELFLLENAFFILQSEMISHSQCFTSNVQNRYFLSKILKIICIYRLAEMLKKLKLIFKQLRRIRRKNYHQLINGGFLRNVPPQLYISAIIFYVNSHYKNNIFLRKLQKYWSVYEILRSHVIKYHFSLVFTMELVKEKLDFFVEVDMCFDTYFKFIVMTTFSQSNKNFLRNAKGKGFEIFPKSFWDLR